MPDRTHHVDVASAHVRHVPNTIERARLLAPRIPYQRDARGHARVPNHADVIRIATTRGLALLEQELGGAHA